MRLSELIICSVIPVTLAICLSRCGMPPIEEILPKGGINCKAAIELPNVPKGRESVEAKVRIYDCKEAK